MNKPEDKTILIVDDEPDVVNFFKSVLEDAGFKVETASNGFEALEKVKNNKPDFISLDLVMPEKSGIKFYYELRKNKEWSKIPVIIVTAHANDEFGKTDFSDLMKGKVISGPATYLEKPIKSEKYVNTVKRILGLPETEITDKAGSKEDLQNEL
ncbi:response regulator, partial [candidate division KSB1 bacterium]